MSAPRVFDNPVSAAVERERERRGEVARGSRSPRGRLGPERRGGPSGRSGDAGWRSLVAGEREVQRQGPRHSHLRTQECGCSSKSARRAGPNAAGERRETRVRAAGAGIACRVGRAADGGGGWGPSGRRVGGVGRRAASGRRGQAHKGTGRMPRRHQRYGRGRLRNVRGSCPTSVDPGMPVETRGTETSQYPEEKKSTETPSVAASERGPA